MHDAPLPADPGSPTPGMVSAAFRELHGTRLHGFALLLTLGDAPLAARLAADALAAGAARAEQLRHPERAAAWLRASVVRLVPRRHPPPPLETTRQALEPLGVDGAVIAGLSALATPGRAALVAIAIERLDRHDVETIVGRRGAALDRLLVQARLSYLDAFVAATPHESSEADGPIAARVRGLAARTMQ